MNLSLFVTSLFIFNITIKILCSFVENIFQIVDVLGMPNGAQDESNIVQYTLSLSPQKWHFIAYLAH